MTGFDNDQDYLESRSETYLRNLPGGAEALDDRLRAEVGVRREIRSDNGQQFEVEVHPDGSEWLLGRVGQSGGTGMMIKGPQAPQGQQQGSGASVAATGTGNAQEGAPQEPRKDGFTEALKDAAKEAGRGVMSGLDQGSLELLKTLRLDDFANWFDSQVEAATGFKGIPYDPPESTGGQMVAGVVQAVPTMIPAARALGGLQKLGTLGRLLYGVGVGATADFAGYSPDDPGFGELAKEIGKMDEPALEAVRSAIEETLAKNEDDGELVKRLKNVGGGALAGGVIEGARGLFKLAKHADPAFLRRLAATGAVGVAMSPDEADASGKTEMMKRLLSGLSRTAADMKFPVRQKLRDLYDQSLKVRDRKLPPVSLGTVGDEEAAAIKAETGLDVAGFERVVDNYGIRHTDKQHGRASTETPRGQLPITRDDIADIPLIVAEPDKIAYGGKDGIGRDIIVYSKTLGDEEERLTFYAEEVRGGKKQLVLQSMWKRKTDEQHGADGAALAPSPTSETLRSAASSDNMASAGPDSKDILSAATGVAVGTGGDDAEARQPEQQQGRVMTIEDLHARQEATGEVQVAGPWRAGLRKAVSIAARDAERPLVERAGGFVKLRPPASAEEAGFLQHLGVPPATGVDFNFAHITSSDDLKAAIDAASQVFAKDIDAAKRGVMKHEATKDIADQLDVSEKVLNRGVGELWNAEQMVAARQMLVTSAQQLDELAQHVRAGTIAPGTASMDETALAFRRQLAFHAAVQAQVKGAQTEIARALSSFRIDVGDDALKGQRIQEMLAQSGGMDDARRMAEDYLAINSRAGRNKFASGSWATKAKNAYFEVWINGLLSNPKTHIVNIAGNAVYGAWQVPERALAGLFGMARTAVTGSEDRVFVGEAMAQIYGSLEGFGDGLRMAAKAFRNEEPLDPIGKIEARTRRAISADNLQVAGPMGKGVDYLGAAIRMPGRFLMAEDEFFKSVGYRMELHSLAYRRMKQALESGASEQDAANVLADTLRNPPTELKAAAEDAARYMTFTKDLESDAMRHVQGLAHTPVGRVILPFVRTPANIMKAAYERSPLYMASPQLWKDISAGGARADVAMARVALGSTMVAWAANLTMEGSVTGGGPADPAEREMWLKSHQPYSVKIGDQWYSYGRIEPLALLFGYTANVVETFKYDVDDKTKDKAALLLVTKVADTLKDKSWLQGVADVSEAMAEPDRFLSVYMARQAGSLGQPVYGSLVRGLVRADDPTIRDSRPDPGEDWALQQLDLMVNGIKSAVGANGDMPPVLDIFGNPKKSQTDDWWEIISPIEATSAKGDPVAEELVRLGMPIAKPDRKIGAVDLSPRQYHDFVELSGKGVKIEGHDFHQALAVLFASPEYLGAFPAVKRRMVKAIYDGYKDVARAELSRRYPDIAPKLMVDQLMRNIR
jgi:hypothetical protein